MGHGNPADPLETRHVFLDTQVYRKLHHNLTNPALLSLARHIADRKVVLHVVDIGMAEVRRQITEDVEAKARELKTIEKTLRRWRHAVRDIPPSPDINAPAVAAALYRDFETTLLRTWSATLHRAMDLPAGEVFADYFARSAPFDQDGSKEFPDAFMLKVLEKWCAGNGGLLHVVTQDAAMARAAKNSNTLRLISTIEELLRRASVQPEIDAERLAEGVVNAPGFDTALEEAMEAKADDLIFIYYGDLPEGEVVGHIVGEIQAVTDYSIAWVGTQSVCMILTVETEIDVQIQYEDRSLAMYDREDGVWFGGDTASAELPAVIPIELFIEVDLRTCRFITADLLRTEYSISEGYDWPDTQVATSR